MRLYKLRIVVLAAVLVGLTILGSKQLVRAQVQTDSKSTGIQGTVRGNPPSVPATITTPSNGQSFTSMPIKLAGICTGDVLVKVFKNGVFGGSAQCTNNSYTLSVDLFEGKNELVARVYDALDQVGPDSILATVTYTQPGYNANAPRVFLTSDFAKRGADPGTTISWPILLSGGTAPYAVSVDWGDQNTELVSLSNAGTFTVKHSYSQSGVYNVVLKVTDANGNSAFLQLVGVGNGALAQTASATTSTGTSTTKTVVIWWPLILAVVFVVIAFWLGNRYKLESLRRQADKRIQY